MRNYALCAAFALVLGAGAALADHAIEPDQANGGDHAVEASQAAETDRAVEKGPVVEAAPVAETEEAGIEPAVTGITREVCTVSDWGVGEVRRECLTEVLPPRQSDRAAQGICMTKYGVRTCF